jgi:hypothetical protein
MRRKSGVRSGDSMGFVGSAELKLRNDIKNAVSQFECMRSSIGGKKIVQGPRQRLACLEG